MVCLHAAAAAAAAAAVAAAVAAVAAAAESSSAVYCGKRCNQRAPMRGFNESIFVQEIKTKVTGKRGDEGKNSGGGNDDSSDDQDDSGDSQQLLFTVGRLEYAIASIARAHGSCMYIFLSAWGIFVLNPWLTCNPTPVSASPWAR